MYSEEKEQPLWAEYQVRNIEKKYDRAGMDFYEVDSIHTSDDADYYKNVWDKGHLAPAAAFTDTYENLHATFSYLNCVLQHQDLNRYEWAYLEAQVRDWAEEHGTMKVRIDVEFGDSILPTEAAIPSGFTKRITFPYGATRCYYFPNLKSSGWEDRLVGCLN